jgi:hypothetical protein
MALTQADLDALDTAIASGTLEVEFNGRRVRYQHTGELIAARAHVAEVVSRNSARPRSTVYRFRFTTSRGD